MSWTNNASFIQRVEQWKEAWIWSQTKLGLNPGFTTYKLQDPGRGTSSLWTSVPLLEKKLGSKDPGQVRELNEKMHTEYLTWDRCSINSRHYYSFWISLRKMWKMIFICNTKSNKGPSLGPSVSEQSIYMGPKFRRAKFNPALLICL